MSPFQPAATGLPLFLRRAGWATSALLAFAPGTVLGQDRPTEPGVHRFVNEQEYDVSGATFLDAFASIETQGPLDSSGNRKHGLTSYELEPSWQLVQSAGRCRMGEVTVVARVTVTLPRWTEANESDTDSQVSWARFINELRRHEYQHRDHVLDAASELFDQLTGLRGRSCRGLRAEAQTRTTEAYRLLQERQAALDAEIGGGDS